MAVPHLRLVDENGEIQEGCEECAPQIEELKIQLKGAEREVRKLRRENHDLKRERDREAREDELWPLGEELFAIWQKACKHPRCSFDTEQFELIRPFLTRKGCGREICERAIAGAEFDAFTYMRKNGSTHRCDEWERIFGDSKQFYGFVNKAPRGWKPPPRED